MRRTRARTNGPLLSWSYAATLLLSCAAPASPVQPQTDAEPDASAADEPSDAQARFGEREFASPGCFSAPSAVENFVDDALPMPNGPSPRQFRLSLPPGSTASEPHALFLSMHACGSDHTAANRAAAKLLETHDVPTITVAPSSAFADLAGNADGNGPDGQKCWNLNAQWYDVPFVEALVDHVLEQYCVDTRNIFIHGRSSGGFAAQAMGCRLRATAIAADRGGIHHPHAPGSNFPHTPPPSADACGPIPALIGFARHDQTVSYAAFAPVAREFWRTNNGCGTGSVRDAAVEAQVCQPGIDNCVCRRFNGCAAPLVMCEWDGGHDVSAIRPRVAGWWFSHFIDAGSDEPGV